MKRILFVCLGNICRSATAEVILRVKGAHLDLIIDSAGTSDWHVGDPPYGPMQAAAKSRGYDMADLRARQVSKADFNNFDLIVAMDESNLVNLRSIAPADLRVTLIKMGDYATAPWRFADVPDPYYTRDFNQTIDILENAIDGLIEAIDKSDQ